MMLINGKNTTRISALDRGLAYGDGLFETLALIDGRPRLWRHHLQRLDYGCRRLGIPVPDAALLEAELQTLCRQHDGGGAGRLVGKITVTRGQGARGYRPRALTPTRIVSVSAWPDYPPERANGIRVRWCRSRLSVNPLLAGIKHLNRLDQVMASREWDDPAIAEGLMCAQDGSVIEGTQSNLFIVRQGTLLTAALDDCGVAGIVRQLICDDVIDHRLPIDVRALSIDDVVSADEVFVCNALIGIWPVIQIIDEEQWADYAAGALTRRVSECLETYSAASAATSNPVTHVG
jgi:4-amino-4-deoxychorismate lyase